jgi:integrase
LNTLSLHDALPISLEAVAQFLGHSSPSVTFRVYARYSPTWLAGAAKALER